MIHMKKKGLASIVITALLVVFCFDAGGLLAGESERGRPKWQPHLPSFLQPRGARPPIYITTPRKQFEIVDGQIVLKKVEIRPWKPVHLRLHTWSDRTERIDDVDKFTDDLIQESIDPERFKQEKLMQDHQERVRRGVY